MSTLVPRHVALIPDGNRRWARQRGKSPFAGHQRGVAIFKDVAVHAVDKGVEYVSLWGLSLDNVTQRSAREVAWLMRLFRQEFRALADNPAIHERRIQIRVLGAWRRVFPLPVRRAVESAIATTRDYDGPVLTFLLAYNGTDAMLAAIRSVVREARTRSRLWVTPELLKRHLVTKDLPPVDLLIRTGGEPHLSAGFMMWEMADAQLYFTETRWPDFSPEVFDAALEDYAARERRRGR